jgi:SAM-dependent methyltransferase
MITRDACPICKATEKTELLSLPFDGAQVQEFLQTYYGGRVDASFITGAHYTIDQCRRCGGIWQREILDSAGMEQLYSHWIPAMASLQRRCNPALSLQYARHAARLLKLFPQDHGQKKILDFGMGWGDWCHMMQSFGFSVHGVELSSERIDHARSIGIPASFPDAIPDAQYDFIYMEQVLEHVPNPHEIVQKLTTLLKPGGYLHIGVPNGKDVAAQCKNPSQVLRKGPAQPLEHINIFTHGSLVSLLYMFGCTPAQQREGLVRVDGIGTLCKDLCLTLARYLPASIFPGATSLMFRKDAR